jgi:hypothetical protein
VLGPGAPILLGFVRGGSYPCVFTTCRDAGAHWVSYRRAPLAATTATPTQGAITRSGAQVQVMLADEMVAIKGYGPARQLTLYEHDTPVLQVLTSDTTATGVGLLYWLRARWRIENMFSCAAARGGIDALADYGMDIGPDTRKVTNPARSAARKTLAAAHDELATAGVVARFRGMVMPLTRTIEANPRSHTVTLGDADLPTGGHPQSRPTAVL